MAASRKNTKSIGEIFDRIENLRTDYLRELGSLSRILITLSIAVLGLTLSLQAKDLSQKIGINWLILVWVFLVLTAWLGFIQIYFFSSRFKSQADYLFSCHIVDTAVAIGDENSLKKFLMKSDSHKSKIEKHYKICVCLVVMQTIFLFAAFGSLACFMFVNITSCDFQW